LKLLIVNADDFGLSEGVNRGVAAAHEHGIVTSASLMVRRPAARQAVTYAQDHREMSLGLHLDLGEWEYRGGEWVVVIAPPSAVEAEIRAQLQIFYELTGRRPTHLDSHQHVHREQPLASIARNIAADFGIPLRGADPKIHYCGEFYGQTARGEPIHEGIRLQALINVLATLPLGVTELVCHPGIHTEDLAYGIERSIEVQTLCDTAVRVTLEADRIRLCSFDQVGDLAIAFGQET